MQSEFKNKIILVTGGTGSIGSVIVRELLRHDPRKVIIFSRDETKQFEFNHILNNDSRVQFVIGDIRDKDRLDTILRGCDIVFHAAALKHVSGCEFNPIEATRTNIIGTHNVIISAVENKVSKFIGISTDKASNPNNVLGCTKLLAEKIMLSYPTANNDIKTKMCFVRFGNVLGSRGSVIPLFLSQIKNNQPLTITDPSMTRFFMSISQAVNLVFKAATLVKDREIFVLKMPVVVMKDMVLAIIEIVKEQNPAIKNIIVSEIGAKPGENKHEKLLSAKESKTALEIEDMLIITSRENDKDIYDSSNFYVGANKATADKYDSSYQKPLNLSELKKMLLNNNDLDFQI